MNRAVLLLTLLSGLLFAANLDGYSVYLTDEAKNAATAREMYERGTLVVPTFNGELRTDRPPLHYYFMMLAYAIWGVGEYGARIFSAFCGLGTVLVTYFGARRLLDARTAFWAGLALVASGLTVGLFHLATPDPYFVLTLTAGSFAWLIGYTERQPAFSYAAYALVGLATLAAGPVAVLLFGLIGAGYLLARREFDRAHLGRTHVWVGLPLLLLVAVPWYGAVHAATDGAWTAGFLSDHGLGLSASAPKTNGGSPLLAPGLLLAGLLPFSAFLVQAVRVAWRDRRTEDLLLFSFVTVGVVVVFYTVSPASYPAPAFPFGAVILGYFLKAVEEQPLLRRFRLRLSAVFYLLLTVGIVAGAIVSLRADPTLAPLKFLASGFLVLPFGALAALIFVWQFQPVRAFGVMAASSMLASLYFFYLALPQVDDLNPVGQARAQFREGRLWVAYQRFNPAFVFYAPAASVPKLTTLEAVAAAVTDSAYVLTVRQHAAELDALPLTELFAGKDLFGQHETVVLAPDTIRRPY